MIANNVLQQVGETVAIIGCGWLGTALAQHLLKRHYTVFGTTQSDHKKQLLAKLGLKIELLSLPADSVGFAKQPIFKCRHVIICIPPNVRQGKLDYADNIATLVTAAEQGAVQKIILLSTTAVYGNLSGELDENQLIQPRTAKVKLLMAAEQCVLSSAKQGIVLRAGGLVGEDRHPGQFFRHNRKISLPNACVNLVHQLDVIAIICQLLVSETARGVYNVVSNTRLSKREFYSIAANALDAKTPMFEQELTDNLGKKVLSDKIRHQLNYRFIHDDLVAWLEQNRPG